MSATDAGFGPGFGGRRWAPESAAGRMWAMAAGGGQGRRGQRHGGRHGGQGFGGGFGPAGPAGFGGGFGPGFGGFGRGPRVGRGDVRVALLALLAEQPMHGYQMIREITERSGGAWRPSPGSVYPVLALLEDEGLVRAEEADGRRVFHLTDAGAAYAAAHRADPLPWDEAAGAVDDTMRELRSIAMQVGAAVMQVAHAGTEAQVTQARDVLTQTRRTLYRILAEDEPGAEPRA